MATRRCNGKTKKGNACKAAPLTDGDFCLAHSDADTRASVGFTPEAGHLGGRPRLPRPHEVLRDAIEAEIDEWLAPLKDALKADRGVVVGAGEYASVEYVPDHQARLRAHEMAFDRVYGRPRQQLEHTGHNGAPIKTEGTLDVASPKVREHLSAALEASAEAERADS